MSESVLHFCRLRHKDSKEPFLDPTADIVEVVHQAFKEIPVVLKDVLSEEDIDYIRSITKVLVTRLEEDRAPVDTQLRAFTEAFNKLGQEKTNLLMRYFSVYIFCRYMLQHRRDGQVDKKDREAIRSSSALLSILPYTDKDTYDKVKEGLKQSIKEYIDTVYTTVNTVDALCIEDESKTIKDIKDLAASEMGATGNTSWESVAAACDKYILETSKDGEKEIAISLAYPDYTSPYYELGVTNERRADSK